MGIKQIENLKGNTEQISFFPILKVLFIAVGVTMSFLFCHIYKMNVEGPVGIFFSLSITEVDVTLLQ